MKALKFLNLTEVPQGTEVYVWADSIAFFLKEGDATAIYFAGIEKPLLVKEYVEEVAGMIATDTQGKSK